MRTYVLSDVEKLLIEDDYRKKIVNSYPNLDDYDDASYPESEDDYQDYDDDYEYPSRDDF